MYVQVHLIGINTPEVGGRGGAGQLESSEKLNYGKFGMKQGKFPDWFMRLWFSLLGDCVLWG